jgi:pimeloyl-ACP methyl ester carboxylesterase
VRRIACLLALGVTLLSLGTPVAAHGAETRPAPVASAALIDLGELFGNENEADENEPEEGDSEGRAPAQESSGPSLLVVLLLVMLALVAARFALFYFRLRRRVRNEGWLAVVLPRRPPERGWGEDRTDRRRTLRASRRRGR